METKYTLIVKNNGSVVQLVEDGPVPPVVPGVFLVLDFTLGLCLNLVIVFTIIMCPALRRLSFNSILLHLCVSCALDCILNLLGAVGFVAVTHLELPPNYAPEMTLACRVNAALTQWTTAIQSVAMATLAVDRVMMFRQLDNPKADARNRFMKFLPALVWLYGTVLVAPIVATSHIVRVRPFPDRYSCGIVTTSDDLNELLYPWLLLMLGYIVPWIAILIICVVITQYVTSARRRQQQLANAALQRSQGIVTSVPQIYSASYQTSWSNWLGASGPLPWEEVKFYFLSSMLLFLYVILLVPHVLCVNVPPLIAREVREDNPASNNSSMSELTAVLTGTYDCFFVWCRYAFTVLVPICVLIIHKEVRKKSEHMFCCCCRNNAVVRLDNPRSISASVEIRTQKSAKELKNHKNKNILRKRHPDRQNKYSRISHYRTPVLFATSEGLHLRTVDDRLEGSYYFNDNGGRGRTGDKEECWTVEPRFLCEFCDVALIASTPTESIGNPQQSVRWGLPLPVLGEEALAEKDLYISDNVTGDNIDEFVRRRSNSGEILVAKFNKMNNRKETRVRFAQTVSEIPLSESGVWSAPEDQVFVEKSAHYKRNESSYVALKPFNSKPKVSVPIRSRMNKLS
ncbi:uncharacterized protein LOC111866695 [Cryptotermes secundus]|uniref:uncharacterized protein LOC111866695 n=1 Tax=Cryptotermes secundus TaxID=105785 RepID=UPI000CD7B615|nr:uncharacterized protein LOC111866695 [Cryptotermes secundus]XP_033608268.1 uncharacterized protein LOC111866695 [Cryptotermes secundus]